MAASLVAVGALAGGCGGGGGGDALPPGFVDELVAKVALPTDLAFAPAGRLLVTGQRGLVHVIDAGGLRARAALDVRERVCTERERGLTGVVADPQFAANRFVYVYYTFDKFGGCKVRVPDVPVNRAVRYRLGADGTLDPGSAKILIDNVPSYHGTHNAGDLAFGKDGYLYVSIGDGGRDYAERTTHSYTNHAARDLNVLLGKIVRLTRDGRPAPRNPFTGSGSTRCATAGPVRGSLRCREVFAWGLRNPFRFAFDPNAASTRFFINDVGEVTWEEVDAGRRGADYGWNLREGPCARGARARCAPGPPTLVDPLVAYAHRTGCRSITGGAFVPDGVWPRAYDGDYLFADFICGKIFVMDSRRPSTMKEFATGLTVPSITSLAFAPASAPAAGALYYTTYARGGEVRRIRYEP